jgi:hypothetical protein
VIERFGQEDTRYRYGWEMSAGVLRVGMLEKLVGMVLGRKERQFPEGQYDQCVIERMIYFVAVSEGTKRDSVTRRVVDPA